MGRGGRYKEWGGGAGGIRSGAREGGIRSGERREV